MSIAKNSLFLRFFLAFWLGLRHAWGTSLPGRACAGLERWWMGQLRGSAVFRFMWREGAMSRAWPDSLACRLFTAVINIPCAVCKLLYRAGRPIWDGSLFCRLLTAVGGAGFFFLGLLMLVMLVAPHGMWNNTYGLLGTVAVAGLFVMGSASRAKDRLELDTLGPYMTLYMAFICIALAGSISTRLSMRFFAFHITAFLLVLLVVSTVRKYEQLQLVVALAVLGVSIASLYGCYQGYVGVEVVASQQDMTVNAGMPGRVYSFFDNPNNFAEQLVMLLPLDLALFLNCRWRGKLLSLLSLCVGAVAIGLTYGRSCWIGLTFAVVVFLALIDWRWVPLFLLAGLAAIPFLPDTIFNRILTIFNLEDSSTSSRFPLYAAALEMLKTRPIRGAGLGTDAVRLAIKDMNLYHGTAPFVHSHNLYLQIWLETGILGVVSYVAAMICGLKSAAKACKLHCPHEVRLITIGAAAAVAGILVDCLADYLWNYPRVMVIFWFLFAILLSGVKLARRYAQKAETGGAAL